jgi:all-trans-8'-apo-beta-carotenal 15,15'-oxygenase
MEELETKTPSDNEKKDWNKSNPPFWEIAPSMDHPTPRPLTPKLQEAMEMGTHPDESKEELGRGSFVTLDWREAWSTYESPPEDPNLIDPVTGYAKYEINDIEGILPDNLVGTLYRNGPGKFGVAGERVQHVLDADGMIYKITFPPVNSESPRCVMFQSRFVETEQFLDEQSAGRFLYRGVFGSGPTAEFLDKRLKNGLNTDPIEPSVISRVLGSAFNTNIKNSANTQVISWGGKLLALFESALPYALDPDTLKTIGEDTLGGVLKPGLPVKMGGGMPSDLEPDFIGGTAHTAHPNVCPKTGNLVGWHWKQVVANGSLEITFTEWDENFSSMASKSFEMKGCELAPHDMAITENCIIMNINSLKMNQVPFILGLKGPAASLAMDGRASITTWVFPRPTASEQFEPYSVETPPCFTIHFSHAYEDEMTGNLVSFFSGWPPSDSKDFLGAWGGLAPHFPIISPTNFWRMEIDPEAKECVSLGIAPGCANMCVEHMLVHPNFNIRRAQNVYGTTSNAVGDSTAPCGYAKLKVETGSRAKLEKGEFNEEVDAFWFGTRYFASEPLIVPKSDGDPDKEEQAYLLGVVRDAARKRDFLAIFDLERDLREGPVCRLYLKSGVPHGLHGCFAAADGKSSIFC